MDCSGENASLWFCIRFVARLTAFQIQQRKSFGLRRASRTTAQEFAQHLAYQFLSCSRIDLRRGRKPVSSYVIIPFLQTGDTIYLADTI
jgi:hypothetical protein